MSELDIYRGLTYEERQAWPIIRKAIKRKPELAAALLEGLVKEGAVLVLRQAGKEMNDLLAMNQAFVAAARQYIDTLPEKEKTT
jgi:hypothetical protein